MKAHTVKATKKIKITIEAGHDFFDPLARD